MKKLLSVLPLLSIISFIVTHGCKKENKTVRGGDNKGVVFINATDPRLAEVETSSGQRITFFGEREADGRPINLSGYTIVSLSDPSKADFVGLDKKGRYVNIFLRTGEKLHFDYEQNDSIAVTISGPDSVSHEINVKGRPASYKSGLDYSGESSRPDDANGSDKHINIKVTAKNTVTQVEKDVQNEQSVVLVRLLGQGIDYSLQAPYNVGKGLYSLPLASAGFTYNDNKAIDKTVELITSTLDKACISTKTGDANIDKPILELIDLSICGLPHPYAKAVCVAANAILFACKVGEAAEVTKLLKSIIKKVDPASQAPSDAAVTVYSQHYKYGTKYAAEATSVSQILLNQSNYDIKIAHDYTENDIIGKWFLDKLVDKIFENGNWVTETTNGSGQYFIFSDNGTYVFVDALQSPSSCSGTYKLDDITGTKVTMTGCDLSGDNDILKLTDTELQIFVKNAGEEMTLFLKK